MRAKNVGPSGDGDGRGRIEADRERETVSRRGFLGRVALGAVAGKSVLGKDTATASPVGSDPSARPVCIFSKHLQWLDLEDTARVAAEMGFDGIDLTVRPGGHVLPERVEEDLPRAVEAARRHGIEVRMMTTAVRDPREETTRRILETAGGLGIRYYRMGYYFYNEETDVVSRLAALRPHLEGLEELNRRHGVYGGYQNHAGSRYVGAPLWDLWYLLRDRDREHLGCQLDFRHAAVEAGLAWPVNLRLLAPFTRMLAVKDHVWERQGDHWRVRNVPLGEGMVDLEGSLAILGEAGFAGPVSLHCEYLEEEGEETLDWIRQDLVRLRSALAAVKWA